MDKGIPKDAKKVFSGILFDVYQWEQENFNKEKVIFEMVERIGSVSVLAVCDGKIIVTKEEQPYYGFFKGIPGGMVDKGLSNEEAARKELLEETGYEAKDLEILYYKQNITHKVVQPYTIYIAKGVEKVSKQNLDNGGERIELEFLSFEEFIEELGKDEFRNPVLENMFFRAKHTQGGLEELKKKLFD